ncbi:MAG: glycerophosphoryl diester phosphodiesterase membrane domain-containing protein [Sphingomonadales bacterium]|nr:glycerophosphoryl diester phosphodiesterase membrane domain-containing protein [Sphingomonadales bacterium]
MGFSGSLALADAFALFKSRFGPMLAVSILYYVLLAVVMAVFGASFFTQMMTMGMNAGGDPAAALPAGFGISIVILYLLIYSLNFFQQAALCRLCSDRHEPNLGDAISTGIRSVPTLLGAAVLLIIALIGVSIVLSIAGAVVMMGARSAGLSLLVALALLIGFAYLGMRLSMILPSVAIEDQRNPIAAIGRSWAMTRGNALKLFLLFVAVMLVMGLIGMMLFFVTLGFPQPGIVPSAGGMIGFFIAMVMFGLTLGIYFVALIAAIHRQLAGPSVAAVQETFA